MPSWLAAGQHAAVWFESRLPSPNTTQSRPTRRIGCTTWTCWPTTAVIARERASRRASASLERVRRVPVLGAPVQVDDHDARAGAARPAGVAQDPPGAGEVDRPRMRQRDPVRHLRVGEEGDADAMHTQQERAPLLAARRERAGVADAGAGQGPPGGVDAGLPAIERVVRGGAAGVEAGRLDRARERRRGVEPRVADRRAGRQRRLDVAERERVAPDPAADRPQQRPEVVAATAAPARARGRRSAGAAAGRRSRRS